MKQTIIIFSMLLLFVSCKKIEQDNPFDAGCPKEFWTPENFKAVQEGTTVKLTWSQPINQISGFKILKGVDGGTATSLQDQAKSTVQLVDNILTGGKIHLYSLTAYAGNNTSNTITAQITPILTAGITTTVVSAVTSNSVQSGGTITTDGGAPITARGVCWSVSQNPTIADTKTNNGTGTANFTSSITGLTPGATYYIRAYVTNSAGTSYGNQVIATTSAILSTINTTLVTAITAITASSGGIITSDGGAAVTASGVCWSTTATPTIANTKTADGTSLGSFTSAITGLAAGTTFYVRAYATNSAGTAYGTEIIFSTLAILPTLTTTAVTSIGTTTANSGGNISSAGGGTITARGVCWSTTVTPTIANTKTTDGTGTGSFTSYITGLTAGTTYYVRAYATNSAGTAYGTEIIFSTLAILPTLTTTAVTSIGTTTANSGGNISSAGGGTITARGVCWSTTAIPTITNAKTADGTGVGSFISTIPGLTANTTYFARAYATNSAGTAYGSQVTFNTLEDRTMPPGISGTITDIDGNAYYTVTIGTQVWMASNLKTTKYKDGTAIPLVADNTAWGALTTPGYCWYNNDATTNKSTYGALYNWYTVNTGKLCPSGWHVPSDAEWTTLTTFLGGETFAGGKLKEAGTSHWLSPNTGATNETVFTALPGGYRYNLGQAFEFIGSRGYWWSSSSQLSTPYSWFRSIEYGSSNAYSGGTSRQCGFSVSCIEDGGPGGVPSSP